MLRTIQNSRCRNYKQPHRKNVSLFAFLCLPGRRVALRPNLDRQPLQARNPPEPSISQRPEGIPLALSLEGICWHFKRCAESPDLLWPARRQLLRADCFGSRKSGVRAGDQRVVKTLRRYNPGLPVSLPKWGARERVHGCRRFRELRIVSADGWTIQHV